jgi:sporulation protein YunB
MKDKHKKHCFKLINLSKFQLKQRFFAFFLILIILLFCYLKYLATPLIVDNTKTQLASYATRSINYAIADTMNQNVSYGDLITIVKDEEGNVSHIEANPVRINLLSKSMSKVVMSNFLEFAKRPIKIALGSFSGISVFAGLGPIVAYNVNPYGEVFCDFSSSFESAGVNQTYHKLYLNISIDVNVVFPFKHLKTRSESEVLLCETIIVGKIPEVYLNSGSLTEMLNLVPEKFSS